MKLALALLLAGSVAMPALADDNRPVTAQERAGVLAALTAAGCRDPKSIEHDDGGFDVEDAVCADGRLYDFELNAQFQVTDRDLEN